jgi:PhnB protein
MKTNRVKAIPAGYHTATPALCVRGATEAIEFYKKAFGAEETARFTGPDDRGRLHRQHLSVPRGRGRGVQSGGRRRGQPDMAPANMFWGNRFAKVTDPFGHGWSLATHIEDVSAEECARRGAEFFARMAKTPA